MLEGKRIIITGAAQGIGATLGEGLAKLGAHVALADIDDPTAAVARVTNTGGRAISVQIDVTRLSDCQRMVSATEAAFGGVDGLVCNAASIRRLANPEF